MLSRTGASAYSIAMDKGKRGSPPLRNNVGAQPAVPAPAAATITAGGAEASATSREWLAVCWEYALLVMRAEHSLRIHHGLPPPWLDIIDTPETAVRIVHHLTWST